MTEAARAFLGSRLTAADWSRFKSEDPVSAVRWAATLATQSGSRLEHLPALRALCDGDTFDAAAAQRVFDFVESSLSLGAAQSARGLTLGWSATDPLDPPALTGTLQMDGERVLLRTAQATLQVVNTGDKSWGTDASVFLGQTVTLKGWPDGGGRLVVEELAPGSSPDFLNGRIELRDGQVGVRVRADKWVAVTQPGLAEALRQLPNTGVILPGAVERDGANYRFDANPSDYYLLTALDRRLPDGTFAAKVAHESGTLTLTAPSTARSDLLDARRFVYGHAGPNMTFTAAWISPPAWAAVWGQPSAQPSRTVESLAKLTSSDAPAKADFAPTWRDAAPPRVYPDGTLLRETSHAEVFVIVGGAKVHIPTPQQLQAMRLNAAAIRLVPDRTTSHIPDVPADGTLLRELDTEAVFIVVGGAKLWVPSPQQFNALGLRIDAIRALPHGKLGQVPEVPLDGARVRELSATQVFEFRGGTKRPVPSATGPAAEVQIAPDGSLAGFPTGAALDA